MSAPRHLLIALFITLSPLSVTAQNYSDCATAFLLCDQAYVHFNVIEGFGEVADTYMVPCFMNGENGGQAEENATWIYFKIKEAGQLSFVITPDTIGDDMDFVLFQIPKDGGCDRKTIIRCMSAGDGKNAQNSPCMGQTGLRIQDKDVTADAGCNDVGDNNWLKPLKAKAGEKYVLLVSNVTAPHGFTIHFKGSALLEPCVAVESEKKD